MSYIGNEPTSVAFLTDTFSGNGSTTAFTMSAAPATTTSILVAVTGVLQDPSTYSVVGTTLTFSAAPPTGTGNISVRYLGIPASGVTTTAYRTITEFTATAGQTTFTPPSYTPGFINVYRNGALLSTTDYTATNGTTVVLGSAASASDLVTIESFYVSSVLNALPQTGGTIGGSLVVNGATGQNPLIVQTNSTERMRVDSSGNVGIGTSSPTFLSGSGLVIERSGASAALQVSRTDASVAGALAILGGDNQNAIYGSGSKPLTIYTNATERMRIAADGTITASNGNVLLVSDTAKSATSTVVDFTGIPSWVKRITVMFSGVSTNGTSFWLVRVGTTSGIQATSYSGGATSTTAVAIETTGVMVNRNVLAADVYHGHCVLTQLSGNTWVFSGITQSGTAAASTQFGASVTLSGTLDRVRITTVNGTDTFDAGTINILYE